MLLVVGLVSLGHGQTSQPVLIDAADAAAVSSAMGEDVIVQGVVQSAQWNSGGTVMNIEFKGAQQSRLTAVVFQKQRKNFDAAFSGDVARTLAGAKVRIKGKLEMYAPQGGQSKGRPEIILDRADQITIMEPAK